MAAEDLGGLAAGTAALTLVLAAACGSGSDASDAGGLDGGDGAAVCTSDSECDDGVFCNGEERCAPGDPEAGPDGCAEASEPACAAGMTCDEETQTCSADCPDADGDGHRDAACGGDDCDDADANRFPGNAEICDPEGHDEDCDPDTLGDTDADGDGFVSDECCNGDTCGADCNDDSGSINPSASEVCNGIDDDCDGDVDEMGDHVLCPGGVCVDGRCRLDHWDRTLGAGGSDVGAGVAMDEEGNVYLAGEFQQTVRFGTDMETAGGEQDIYVISYAGDGTYRWHRTFGGDMLDTTSTITAGPDGRLYVVGWVEGEVDFGGGMRAAGGGRGYLLALSTEGDYEWDAVAARWFTGVVAVPGGVVVSGAFEADEDFGGGTRSADSNRNGVVLRYTDTGAYEWDTTFTGSASAYITAEQVGFGGGQIAIGGRLSNGELSLDGSTYPVDGDSDLFVVSLDPDDGTPNWHEVFGGSGDTFVGGTTVRSSGDIYLSGRYRDEIDLGDDRTRTAATTTEGFLIALQADGSYWWHRFLTGPSRTYAADVAPTADGGIVVLGDFRMGRLDLGGGGRMATDHASFLVRYTADGTYRDDAVYQATDGSLLVRGVAVGPGGSTAYSGAFRGSVDFGSGERVSDGDMFDAFVVRPGT